MLGAWKYVKKPAAYVYTDHTSKEFTSKHNDSTAIGTLTEMPIDGRIYNEDSFPMADGNNELWIGSRDENTGGRDYSIPLHLLSGIFRLKNLLPVWAMGENFNCAQAAMQMVC